MLKSSPVTAPVNAVIWKVSAREGEEVNPNDEIAQLIDPRKVVVDAFFNEKDVARPVCRRP